MLRRCKSGCVSWSGFARSLLRQSCGNPGDDAISIRVHWLGIRAGRVADGKLLRRRECHAAPCWILHRRHPASHLGLVPDDVGDGRVVARRVARRVALHAVHREEALRVVGPSIAAGRSLGGVAPFRADRGVLAAAVAGTRFTRAVRARRPRGRGRGTRAQEVRILLGPSSSRDHSATAGRRRSAIGP